MEKKSKTFLHKYNLSIINFPEHFKTFQPNKQIYAQSQQYFTKGVKFVKS